MRKILKTTLLSNGMLAVVFYFAHVLLGGFLWKGYSHFQQPISDLTATGAPNRDLLLVLTNIYGILALIFAVSFSIFEGRKYNKLVLWGGISFILMHFVSISYGFFPQDLPGNPTTFAGTMHLVVTALIVPFTILSPILIGFGLKKEQRWRKLGKYSIITGILIFVFGGLTGIFFANKLPYFGLVERLNIGTLQVWTFVLSYNISKKAQ